jgi:hypothetical protein
MSDSLVYDKVGALVYWFTYKSSKPLNQLMPFGLEGLNKPIKPINLSEYEKARQELLYLLSQKQSFRVATGKSTWVSYETFNPSYNLREILNDEIVIEFDSEDKEIVFQAVNQTGLNLYNAGYQFEYWDHGGKSPHLHIRDLPIEHLEADKRKLFKTMFIKKYVPSEFHKYVDFSLTGVHLIALEWTTHWKGKYGVKRLLSVFDGQNKTNYGVEE